MPDWDALYADFGAAVDWPAAAFWREIADDYPDAIVLLSARDTDSWWRSVSNTIFLVPQGDPPDDPVFARQVAMATDLLTMRFTANWLDETEAKHAYDAHNKAVRTAIAPDRLVEWPPGDGWEPICAALRLPVPDTPFPHVNTRPTGSSGSTPGLIRYLTRRPDPATRVRVLDRVAIERNGDRRADRRDADDPPERVKTWSAVGPPSVRSRTASTTTETGWCSANVCSHSGIVATGTNDDDAKTSGAMIGNAAAWAVSCRGP